MVDCGIYRRREVGSVDSPPSHSPTLCNTVSCTILAARITGWLRPLLRMCAPTTLLHGVSHITGIVVHNRRGDDRLSHITEARSASPSDRRLAKGEQRLLPRGWRLLSE